MGSSGRAVGDEVLVHVLPVQVRLANRAVGVGPVAAKSAVGDRPGSSQLKVPPPAFTTDPAAVGASHKHTDKRDEFWPKVNVTDEHSRKLEMRPRSNAAPPRKLPETAQRAVPCRRLKLKA